MAMLAYFEVFPDKTRTELRNVSFTAANANANDALVGGTFCFTEYFCTDPKCNCQRVLVKVYRVESEDARPVEVATISYSWNPDSDEVWSKLNSETANPFLDPIHRQAPYASELLDFWYMMIQRDRAYASRIERHYDEIRAEVGETAERSARRDSTRQKVGWTLGPRTKHERKARKQRLARVRKQK